MPQKKSPSRKKVANSEDQELSVEALELRRIAKLLALIATKGQSQAERILFLNSVGYSASEIAVLMNTTPNTVSVTIYQSTKKRKKSTSQGG